MSQSKPSTGRCLCGKVTYEIEEEIEAFNACHCVMCRRWASGPFLAVHCKAEIRFKGQENIVRYRSSDWAERGFCRVCGSNLFYFVVPSQEYILSAGTLDNQESLKMTSQIFIDEKPGCYDFANDTIKKTGDEVFAEFAPKD